MAFRTHLGRSLDLSSQSNRTIALITVAAGLTGVALTAFGGERLWLGVEAGAAVFLSWALVRDLDPDREATALMAAVAAGLWALAGSAIAILPLLGFLGIARIVSETTGRRPLRTDLIVVVIAAAAISFTPLGFVVGFGWVVAIYVDNVLSDEPNPEALLFAAAGAISATVVASVAGAFPRELPSVQPLLVLSAAALGLLTVLRAPPKPTSQVDSRRKTFIRQDRIHAARTGVALVMVLGALLGGIDAPSLGPVAVSLALVLASSEVERAFRARL